MSPNSSDSVTSKSRFQRQGDIIFFVLKALENFGRKMVRLRRLELPRVLAHSDLNAARLPVPPQPHRDLPR